MPAEGHSSRPTVSRACSNSSNSNPPPSVREFAANLRAARYAPLGAGRSKQRSSCHQPDAPKLCHYVWIYRENWGPKAIMEMLVNLFGRHARLNAEPLLVRHPASAVEVSRHSPDLVWLWGQGSPLRPPWATVNRAPRAQQETNQSVDRAEALKRAALPASRRTFAVVVCRI
jgi:hypothetical protein